MENIDEAQDFNQIPIFSRQLVAGDSPNNPPWNTPIAFGLWIASVVLVFLAPIAFILPYLVSQGNRFTDNAQLKEFLTTDPTALLLSVIAILPVHALTLLFAWLIVTNVRRYPFWRTLGDKMGGYRWWHLAGILIGFFIFAKIVGYYIPEQDNDLLKILRSSRAAVYVVAFLATFTAPIVEEVIYRGVLYSALQRSIGVLSSVVIVTALFAGVHFFQYWGSPGTILLICSLSLILTLVRARSGNLLPCIILHFVFNGLQSLLLVFSPDSAPEPEQVTSLIRHII